jgi:hypothetical protein
LDFIVWILSNKILKTLSITTFRRRDLPRLQVEEERSALLDPTGYTELFPLCGIALSVRSNSLRVPTFYMKTKKDPP